MCLINLNISAWLCIFIPAISAPSQSIRYRGIERKLVYGVINPNLLIIVFLFPLRVPEIMELKEFRTPRQEVSHMLPNKFPKEDPIFSYYRFLSKGTSPHFRLWVNSPLILDYIDVIVLE